MNDLKCAVNKIMQSWKLQPENHLTKTFYCGSTIIAILSGSSTEVPFLDDRPASFSSTPANNKHGKWTMHQFEWFLNDPFVKITMNFCMAWKLSGISQSVRNLLRSELPVKGNRWKFWIKFKLLRMNLRGELEKKKSKTNWNVQHKQIRWVEHLANTCMCQIHKLISLPWNSYTVA